MKRVNVLAHFLRLQHFQIHLLFVSNPNVCLLLLSRHLKVLRHMYSL